MGNLSGALTLMKLSAIKAALLSSYETDGAINHLDGVNLPSQESVNEIARECMHLLFPGYFEESRLTKKSVPKLVDLLLARFGSQLEVEIEKCLRFSRDPHPAARARTVAMDALGRLPELRKAIRTDVEAAYLGDPAARSYEEIILAYPCVLGISLQRFAHVLYGLGVPLLPRMITEFAHERTGMDIHPGARIGTHFFVDHGTGVVIGETAIIGSHVKLYQGVTLGAKSFDNVNLCSALCRTGQAPVACKIAAVLGRGWPCKPGQAACDWRARCRGAQMLNARYFPAVCI